VKKLLLGVVLAALFALTVNPISANSGVCVTGGGMITEGQGKEAPKITFGLNVFVDPSGHPAGHLEVNFHNVYDDELDKAVFKSSGIDWFSSSLNELDGIEYNFVSLTFNGQLNGEEGWSISIRLSDFGEPGKGKRGSGNHSDAVRISLFNPSVENVYDTATEGQDFPREQAWRTLLDGGNIQIHSG
jgi:hypothetical protein